jgi:hypothetical protein
VLSTAAGLIGRRPGGLRPSGLPKERLGSGPSVDREAERRPEIVGTYGGGTGLATQRESLELLGCYGQGKADSTQLPRRGGHAQPPGRALADKVIE